MHSEHITDANLLVLHIPSSEPCVILMRGKKCGFISFALQQNKEQVAQAYFEIWAIEVGIGVKDDSSVDFEMFVFFLHTSLCLLSPPCNI